MNAYIDTLWEMLYAHQTPRLIWYTSTNSLVSVAQKVFQKSLNLQTWINLKSSITYTVKCGM